VVISRPDDFVMGPKPSAISEGVCPEDATETDETARARAHLIESVPVCATPKEHPKCIRLSFAIGSSIPNLLSAGTAWIRCEFNYMDKATKFRKLARR